MLTPRKKKNTAGKARARYDCSGPSVRCTYPRRSSQTALQRSGSCPSCSGGRAARCLMADKHKALVGFTEGRHQKLQMLHLLLAGGPIVAETAGGARFPPIHRPVPSEPGLSCQSCVTPKLSKTTANLDPYHLGLPPAGWLQYSSFTPPFPPC